MKRKLTGLFSAIVLTVTLASAVAFSANDNSGQLAKQDGNEGRYQNKIFQYSTINAIMQGQYEGDIELSEMKKHGNMGIGTINDLDGELIELDSKFYQVDSTGKLTELSEKTKTPFAVTTEFNPQKTLTVSNVTDFNDLGNKLKAQFENKNHFYAIKLTGTFKYVKARTVPKQTRPYPPLTEVTPNQSVFEFNNVKGTIIGFYTPNYASTIQVPGFHMHFITDDKTSGGHILNFQFDTAQAEIQDIPEFDLKLPDTADFANADLTKTTVDEIEESEGER